jgi:hypothetical protein
MMTTLSLPNYPCCNPLWQYFVALLSRPQFLLGTGGFAAAVLAGNSEPANSQTESSEGLKVIASPQPTVTIYVARRVITRESEQPEAGAVAIEGDRILAVGSLDRVKESLGNQPYFEGRKFEASHDDRITTAISAAIYDPEDINFVDLSRVRG